MRIVILLLFGAVGCGMNTPTQSRTTGFDNPDRDDGVTDSTTIFAGMFVHGFEVDSFVPCGSREKWWVLLPQGAIEAYERIAAPYQAVYMEAQGKISSRGRVGHLGQYARYFTVTKVLHMSRVDSAACRLRHAAGS